MAEDQHTRANAHPGEINKAARAGVDSTIKAGSALPDTRKDYAPMSAERTFFAASRGVYPKAY